MSEREYERELPERDPRERLLHAFAIASLADPERDMRDYVVYAAGVDASYQTLKRIAPKNEPWCGYCLQDGCDYCTDRPRPGDTDEVPTAPYVIDTEPTAPNRPADYHTRGGGRRG